MNRRFTADGPRRLWVADITYVRTWSGFAYVAFVTDVYSRRIVGWNVAATPESRHPPVASPRHGRVGRRRHLDGLVHHADHGSNYMSLICTDRVVELGAEPSTGTVGDSCDCEHHGVVVAAV